MLNDGSDALVKYIKNKNKNIKLMLIETTFYIFNVLNAEFPYLYA
jgi:hypothetical protein